MFRFLIILFTLNLVFCKAALSEERHIHLNGEHLTTENIVLFDQVLSSTVPDGFYWMNFQTGEWGYEGNNEVEGIAAAFQQQGQQHASNTYINNSQNGSVVSGRINGQNCTYVSAGAFTVKDCD